MRLPDRPEAGSRHAGQDTLADRLGRLPDGHPSSPRGDWREHGAGELEPSEDPQDFAEPDDEPLTSDDAEPAEPEGGMRAVPRPSLRAAAGGATAGQGPYRPWFADGGPARPWFAADPDGPATPDG